jgi:misacylated tRNA(Ala) deacylase
MTRRLFWEDTYIREFDGKVIRVEGNRVVLDQTAFNPRGGGLVSDLGQLGGSGLVEVIKENEEVVHIVNDPSRFRADERVHGVLDWDRRYKVMKMHTTAHILSSIVNRETGALITGNQISPDESRVDFNLEAFDREKLTDYIRMANDVVRRGVPVTTYFMEREKALATPGLVKLANAMPPSVTELRIVQIGDVDIQADGGVHVANTSEIGEIQVQRADNKGKSNRRLYFTLR